MIPVREEWLDRAEVLGAYPPSVAWLREHLPLDVTVMLERLTYAKYVEAIDFDVLERMLRIDYGWSTNALVQRGAALHSQCPPRVLLRLGYSQDPYARMAVLSNPRCLARTATRLARDPRWVVRRAVAYCPASPSFVLVRLARDEHHEVRGAAMARLASGQGLTESTISCR